MEDDEEEEDDDNIPGFAEYGAFDETAMGEVENEVAAESPLMILVRPFVMHRETAKVKGIGLSSSACMLEDHKKLLYPNCEEGHTRIAAMEGKE